VPRPQPTKQLLSLYPLPGPPLLYVQPLLSPPPNLSPLNPCLHQDICRHPLFIITHPLLPNLSLVTFVWVWVHVSPLLYIDVSTFVLLSPTSLYPNPWIGAEQEQKKTKEMNEIRYNLR